MKKTKVTLSKTIKLPIKGIQYSNRNVAATVEYEVESEKFNADEAWNEINRIITKGRDEDPSWIRNFDNQTTAQQKKAEFTKKGGK